jgi:hypothetical protein
VKIEVQAPKVPLLVPDYPRLAIFEMTGEVCIKFKYEDTFWVSLQNGRHITCGVQFTHFDIGASVKLTQQGEPQ